MSRELDPFYKELIEVWKHGGKNGGPGGWAGYYYCIFSHIISINNFKNIIPSLVSHAPPIEDPCSVNSTESTA
jgi:hypothetical protein